MVLYGIDRNALGIRRLQVDSKSIADGSAHVFSAPHACCLSWLLGAGLQVTDVVIPIGAPKGIQCEIH